MLAATRLTSFFFALASVNPDASANSSEETPGCPKGIKYPNEVGKYTIEDEGPVRKYFFFVPELGKAVYVKRTGPEYVSRLRYRNGLGQRNDTLSFMRLEQKDYVDDKYPFPEYDVYATAAIARALKASCPENVLQTQSGEAFRKLRYERYLQTLE